jgi:hypothetical protein
MVVAKPNQITGANPHANSVPSKKKTAGTKACPDCLVCATAS